MAGCVLSAVAAALGVDPNPASLVNIPRLIPSNIDVPIPITPPPTCSSPKADFTICTKIPGNLSKFNTIITNTINKYKTAITGTNH